MEEDLTVPRGRRRTFTLGQASPTQSVVTGEDIYDRTFTCIPGAVPVDDEEGDRGLDSLSGNSILMDSSTGIDNTGVLFENSNYVAASIVHDHESVLGLEEKEKSVFESALSSDVEQLIINLDKGLIKPFQSDDDSRIFDRLNAKMESLYKANAKRIGFSISSVEFIPSDKRKEDSNPEIFNSETVANRIERTINAEKEMLKLQEGVIQGQLDEVNSRINFLTTHTRDEKARIKKLIETLQEKETLNRKRVAEIKKDVAQTQEETERQNSIRKALVCKVELQKEIPKLLFKMGGDCICKDENFCREFCKNSFGCIKSDGGEEEKENSKK